MFVTKLTAENFKRLEAVEIDLDAEGGVTTISGPNGAGKTSVIDALASVIAGRNAPKIPEPIRAGEDSAQVIATTSDGLVITRRWKRKEDGSTTSSLEVTTDVGLVKRSPQQLLDGFVRGYMLDPLAFTRLDAKKQAETLLEIVELPFVPAELEAQRSEIFATRTIANRDLKQLAGQLASLPPRAEGVPLEEQSAAALLQTLAEQQEHNRAVREREVAFVTAGEALDRAERILKQAEQQHALALAAAKAAREDHEDGAEPIDTADAEAAIANVDRTNAAVRANAQRDSLVDAFAAAEARVDQLETQLETVATTRREGLAAAAFPVEGLSFDEDGQVTLRGVPFSQASAAEQLVASIAIAGSAQPDLQLVLVRDASLLDGANRVLVAGYAEEHDLRIVMEVVDEHAETGVVISDGRLA